MENNFLIVLVDDDMTLSDILGYAAKDAFPEARFLQVHSYSQLRHYFKYLTGYGPQLMLLDLDLNENRNGLDSLAFLRANDQTCHLPVVMLTASDSATDILDAMMVGAASFSTKPTDLGGWKTYLASLRAYWLHTVKMVPVWFPNNEQEGNQMASL